MTQQYQQQQQQQQQYGNSFLFSDLFSFIASSPLRPCHRTSVIKTLRSTLATPISNDGRRRRSSRLSSWHRLSSSAIGCTLSPRPTLVTPASHPSAAAWFLPSSYHRWSHCDELQQYTIDAIYTLILRTIKTVHSNCVSVGVFTKAFLSSLFSLFRFLTEICARFSRNEGDQIETQCAEWSQLFAVDCCFRQSGPHLWGL